MTSCSAVICARYGRALVARGSGIGKAGRKCVSSSATACGVQSDGKEGPGVPSTLASGRGGNEAEADDAINS